MRSFMNRVSPAIILLIIAAATCLARTGDPRSDQPDTATYVSPYEVLITAPRMTIPLKENPAATSVVTGTELKSLMPRGAAVDEALSMVPGVKIDNQANGERVHLSMRGQGILTETGIRSIKVLLDEIPINDPTGFAPDFFDVDFSNLARVEVLRGPATSLYGGGAAGGILNFVSGDAPNTPLFGTLSTIAGSNGFWKGAGQFGGQDGDVNYRVALSRTGGDGYRTHTHFWQNSVYGKATYTPSASLRLTPIFSWNNTYHENPEGLSLAQYQLDPKLPNDDAIPFNEHMETNRVTEGLAGMVQLAPDHELHFNGYIKQTRHLEANNHVFDHQDLTTPGTSLQYSYTMHGTDGAYTNVVSAGTDFQWQTIDEHLQPNDHAIELPGVLARQEIRTQGTGLFAIDRFDLGHAWSFTGSVRYDRIHNELTDQMKTDSTDNSGSAVFSNVTGRLGVTWSASANISLYGAWGMGFIPPSTEELLTNPADTVRYGGFNPTLEAATSNSFEAGVRGIVNHELSFDLTGYYMTTTNDFDRYRLPGRGHGEEGTFYKNIGASKRMGIESAFNYRPVSPLLIQVAYTYSGFKYDLTAPIPIIMDDTSDHRAIRDGNWLPNSPQHQLAINVQYDVTPDLTIGAGTQTLSKTYINGANIESEAAAGYTLLSARANYRWLIGGRSGDLFIQGRNLTGEKYVAFTEPDPGGNAYQPGAGSEVFAGIRINLGK